MEKNLEYWEKNAEEDYITTPISVLRYISESEKQIEELKAEKNKIHKQALENSQKSFIENTKLKEGVKEFVKQWTDNPHYPTPKGFDKLKQLLKD